MPLALFAQVTAACFRSHNCAVQAAKQAQLKLAIEDHLWESEDAPAVVEAARSVFVLVRYSRR